MPGGQVDVEVARVVRQSHLLDERPYVGVDDVASPRRVGAVVGDVRVAHGEGERQRVADGHRQGGDDEVERDSQQHERGRRRTGRLLLSIAIIPQTVKPTFHLDRHVTSRHKHATKS